MLINHSKEPVLMTIVPSWMKAEGMRKEKAV